MGLCFGYSFGFLVGRGLLGYNVDTPVATGIDDDVLSGRRDFGDFGKMTL